MLPLQLVGGNLPARPGKAMKRIDIMPVFFEMLPPAAELAGPEDSHCEGIKVINHGYDGS
jgi:hypothetical protein